MTRFLALLGVLLVPCTLTSAQTLNHVRIDTDRAAELAERFEREGFDVMEGSVTDSSIELVVSPESRRILEERGFELVTLAVGRPFNEIQREQQANLPPDMPVPPGYSDLAQVYSRMQAFATANPSICQFVDLTAKYASAGVTATYEGRSMYAVKISDNVTQDEDELTMLIVAAHHCREIVTPEIALLAIQNLTSQYGTVQAVTNAVNNYEIWIAPVWNPDGYNEVFVGDNLWRKNRRVFAQGTGVDLNRNYPVGWGTACGGSSTVSSDTYKGPSAGSEAETKTMLAWHADKRFTKILDYHSTGNEVLWSYGTCWSHPLNSFLQQEAIALSNASGYGGANRRPSANGEEYEEGYMGFGSHAFLIETHSQFQPTHASALAEAAKLWPGILWLFARPVSISGHVTDACSGLPINANVSFGLAFTNGEKNGSGGPFGRYHMTLPAGNYNATFSLAGYATQVIPITVTANSAQVLDVALVPNSVGTTYCTAKTNSCGGTPGVSSIGTPSASSSSGFFVEGSNARFGKAGLVIYTNMGRRVPAVPFGNGGLLCLQSPVRRTVTSVAFGGTPGQCDADYSFDMNAFAYGALGGNPQSFLTVPGTQVNLQWWGRDTQAHGEYLSNALEYVICP